MNPNPRFLTLLTWKRASRHNGAQYFNIKSSSWTSKSGPKPWCFEHVSLNVNRATTACTFSTSQLPKVIRAWCAVTLLTSICASRHNGVHFFHVSTPKSDPNMVCFDTFDFQMCLPTKTESKLFHIRVAKDLTIPEAICSSFN